MKLGFSFKNKEANLEADIEGIVKEGMSHKSKRPPKKTRYQIRQEEKRKNEELRQKHFIQYMLMMGGMLIFILIICAIGSVMNW